MDKTRYVFLNIFTLVIFIGILVAGLVTNDAMNADNSDELPIQVQTKENATLVDSKGNFIVYNKKTYEVWIDIPFLKKQKKFDTFLPKLLEKFTRDEIDKKRYLKWGSYKTLMEAKKDVGDDLKKFVQFYPIGQRFYNDMYSLNLLIGKIDKTTYGIEPYLFRNQDLQKEDEIKLTIDLSMQKVLYEELSNVMKERQAKGAFGMVMETKTGKIRSSVSLFPWNFGFMGIIEPGSTLKPLIYGLTFDEKILSPDEKLNCNYEYKPLDDVSYVVKEAESTENWGYIDIKDALAYSSNVAIARTMSRVLGRYSKEWIYNKFLFMGFGQRTGVEFEGEIPGFMENPKKWSKITPFQYGIGQGLGVTPVQLTAAFNALVNSGIYLQPTFLENATVNGRKIYSINSSSLLVDWMRQTLITGTAKDSTKEGISLGGKTGTAMKAVKGLGYQEGKYYSLFAGYYPATDPLYTIVIIVDEPQKKADEEQRTLYGGKIAAPIASNFFYKLFKNEDDTFTYAGTVYKDIVPDLIGYNVNEAIYILQKLGVPIDHIVVNGNGEKVIDQIPKNNYYIKDLDYIQLFTGQ